MSADTTGHGRERRRGEAIAGLVAAMVLVAAFVPPTTVLTTEDGQPSETGQPPSQDQGCGRQWTAVYGDDPTTASNQGYQNGVADTALASDGGRLYLTGSERNGQRTDAVTTALTSDGDQLWVAGVESARLSGVAVSPDGSYVVGTGYVVPEGSDWPDLLTVAYDAATGDELWRDIFGAERWDEGMDVAISPDGGRVYVTGTLRQTDWTQSPNDAVTIALDATTGEHEWVSVREPEMQNAGSLAVSPDGATVFVLGSLLATGSDGGVFPHTSTFVAAYVAHDRDDPSREGQERWSTVWEPDRLSGDRDNDGGPVGMALSSDGDRLYVANSVGYGDLSSPSRFYDWVTLGYDTTTGQQLWSTPYRGPFGGSTENPGDNRPTAIVASPTDDRVFVTGWSADADDNSDFVFATVAYDRSGNQLWVDRSGDPRYATEGASDAAVSADGGTLLVTGANIPYLVDQSVRQRTIAYDTTDGTRRSTIRFDHSDYDGYVVPHVDMAADGRTAFVSGGVSSQRRGDDTGDYWDWFSVAHDIVPSSIDVSRARHTAAGVEVAGQLTLCGDAHRRQYVSIDSVGDASGSDGGLDLVEGSIESSAASDDLVFSLKVMNRESVNGDEVPATGYGWPVTVDDADDGLWLGAGTALSSVSSATSTWWGLCSEQTQVTGDCSMRLEGTATNREVAWRVPLQALGAEPGSVITAGSAYNGTPASFQWALGGFTQGVAPADVAPAAAAYKLPGEVLIGFASVGTPASEVAFDHSLVAAGGAFDGRIAGPPAGAEHRLWIKSCFGLAESPTCARASSIPISTGHDAPAQ